MITSLREVGFSLQTADLSALDSLSYLDERVTHKASHKVAGAIRVPNRQQKTTSAEIKLNF